MRKASFGLRFVALLLDGIILNIINSVFLLFYPFLFFLIAPFSTFLYYGICEGSSMSATLGKKICGLMVVDENGNKLTSAQGFTRSICRVVSMLTFGIGFLIALFDERGKALHDRMANTFVTSVSPSDHTAFYTQSQNNSPKVVCISGTYAGKAFPVTGQGIMIGRDKDSCEIAFPESTQGISRVHCKIQFNQQTQMFVLYDLGSTYGTFTEYSAKVLQGQPVAMKPGEGFYLASRAYLFRVSL